MTDLRDRILIVDDEKFQRTLLEGYLHNFGYRVCSVSSGAEALEFCELITPDLILMDIMMPDMDGIEACRALKKMPPLANVPIVMLTSKNDPVSIHHSFDAGAIDFLIKPVNDTLLKNRIEFSIHNRNLANKLQQKEKQLSQAQEIAKLGSIKIFMDSQRVELSINFHEELGFSSEQTQLSFTDYLKHIHPDDSTHVQFILDEALKKCQSYILEYRIISNEQQEFIILQKGEYIRPSNENEAGYLYGTFQDVTHARSIDEDLNYTRYYDPLTDLTNKSFFTTQIKHLLEHYPEDSLFAIFFIGLDNFTYVNDAYGHLGGDKALQVIAKRLLQYEHAGNVVSRFGGDVFTMLVKDIHHIDECTRLLDSLLELIQQPITIDDNEIYLTASIGASVFPLESEKESQLLIGAEAAMMLSREEGGNRYTYRTQRMNAQTQKHLNLLKDMRIALQNKDFVVYYQPQIDTASMQICGMEALVRWLHPDKGLIPPDEFIRAAEESGLIVPIGSFVLQTACEDTRHWLDMGYELDVGVNMSAQQFLDQDIMAEVTATLQSSGLPAKNLEIEITESMSMKDYQYTIEVLNQLRSLGIKTSMDDFGTGYSSLSQLQSLPLDTLKVDQAFVRCISKDRHTGKFNNSAIATAIIAMSHSLGLRVIAEGVETSEQCDFLKQQNSDVLQGYLFSRPIPKNEFEALLLKQKDTPSQVNNESGKPGPMPLDQLNR